MTNSLLLETFRNNLPQKPYCTDDLSFGLKIRPAELAIKKYDYLVLALVVIFSTLVVIF